MPVTTPPTLTDAPTSPDRADRATFTARAIALDDYTKNTQIPQLRLALANVAANATDAASSAIGAAASATTATTQATAAQNAATSAGATAFVSGATVAVGDARYSLVNLQSYRAATAGVRTTDPSLDMVNWTSIGALPSQTGNAGKFLRTDGTTASWRSAGIEIVPPGGGTLTNPALYQAFVSNAAYTLPDFTGSSTFGLASLSNSPDVPSTVTTADGWTISPGLAANTFKAVAPLSSTNAHGAWGSITQTPPIAATFTAISTPTLEGTVQLSAGLVVLLYSVSSSTGLYAVALNTTTNTFGPPVSLGTTTNSGFPLAIFADTASTFVVGFANASSNGAFIAGSVSGTTITLGSAAAATYGYLQCIQLASGLYVQNPGNGQVEAFSVSGIVCTKGNNASSNAGSKVSIVKVSSTSFLAVGYSTTASPAQLRVAVCSVSGNTTTGNTMVLAASTILRGSISLQFLRALALGGPFVCCAQDDTTGTTGDYYGITVSGVTPTIGTVLQVANALPSTNNPNTYQYPPAAASTPQNVLVYGATQLLVGVSAGAYALSISGTTLTVGAKFGASQPYFVTDALTGANVYAVQNSTIDKITISGTAITSSYSVAAVPKVVASDTLNDKVAYYVGTWYAWTLPAMSVCITPTKWLGISSSVVSLYGAIT